MKSGRAGRNEERAKEINVVKPAGRARRGRDRAGLGSGGAGVRDTGLPGDCGGRSQHCPRGFPPVEAL